jgi:hypothetical protein
MVNAQPIAKSKTVEGTGAVGPFSISWFKALNTTDPNEGTRRPAVRLIVL